MNTPTPESPMDDTRLELDMWQDMWDEMEDGNSHSSPQNIIPQEENPVNVSTAQDCYYDFLDMEYGTGPELLQENKSQNPIYPDSQGPDHTTTPAVWVTEEIVKEVEELKNKLFEVENKLARKMGGDNEWVEKAYDPDNKKLMSEIDSLKKRIEKVSSNLGIKDEPSPWKIKD